MEPTHEPAAGEGRDRWRSRTAFLLAAIGSAVGLGNLWRFPFLCYRHGGGSFLVPYIAALLVIGLPTLFLELGLGAHMQRGDVEAFGRIHKRLRGIGVGSVFAGFAITTYYSNIISWAVVYFIASFIDPLPWTGDADAFLFDTVMQLDHDKSGGYGPAPSLARGVANSLSGYVYGGLVLVWLVTYICIFRGVRSESRAVMFTMPVPLLCLLALFIHHLTLPGAGDGIRAYIGEWKGMRDIQVPVEADAEGQVPGLAMDSGARVPQFRSVTRPGGHFLSGLEDARAWSDAGGQIFFTLSVSMGVMTAFGSYRESGSDMVKDHLIIAGSNTLISIFAGFVVFSILGNVAYERGESVWDLGSVSSVGLVFQTYPAGLASFPYGVSNLMSAVFFLCLFTLGIDSAFSIVEGVTTVIHDTPRFAGHSREGIAAVVCGAGFLCSTLYATTQGLFFLDVFDHYINSYALFVVAGFESYAVAWVYGYGDLTDRVGVRSARILTVGYTVAAAVGVVLCGALVEVEALADRSYNILIGVAVGVAMFAASYVAAFRACDQTKAAALAAPRGLRGGRMNIYEFLDRTFWTGTEKLRDAINAHETNWKLPRLWDLIVKYINPALLCSLCVNTAVTDARAGGYGGGIYPDWLQVCGGFLLFGTLGLMVLFMIFPGWWDAIASESKAAGPKATTDPDLPSPLSLPMSDSDRVADVILPTIQRKISAMSPADLATEDPVSLASQLERDLGVGLERYEEFIESLYNERRMELARSESENRRRVERVHGGSAAVTPPGLELPTSTPAAGLGGEGEAQQRPAFATPPPDPDLPAPSGSGSPTRPPPPRRHSYDPGSAVLVPPPDTSAANVQFRWC